MNQYPHGLFFGSCDHTLIKTKYEDKMPISKGHTFSINDIFPMFLGSKDHLITNYANNF